MSSSMRFSSSTWALVLGASSGFGGATALELARHGMNIFGVHFDRAASMPAVERLLGDIRSTGVKAAFFNINASDEARRNETLDAMKKDLSPDANSTLRTIMHSLAF